MDASLRGFGKQIQLVLGEVQIRGNLVFVGRDKPFDVFLNQLNRRCPPRLAIIAQRPVLPCRQLEGNRMVMVVATFAFFVLFHNMFV